MQRHVESLRVFHATQGKHLGAAGRHFQHRLVVDDGDTACSRHNARIGGEHAIDVGVNLAYVGVQVATGALAVDDAEAAVVMWLSLAMASMAGDMYEDLLDYTFTPQRLDEIAASVDTRMRQ